MFDVAELRAAEQRAARLGEAPEEPPWVPHRDAVVREDTAQDRLLFRCTRSSMCAASQSVVQHLSRGDIMTKLSGNV